MFSFRHVDFIDAAMFKTPAHLETAAAAEAEVGLCSLTHDVVESVDEADVLLESGPAHHTC